MASLEAVRRYLREDRSTNVQWDGLSDLQKQVSGTVFDRKGRNPLSSHSLFSVLVFMGSTDARSAGAIVVGGFWLVQNQFTDRRKVGGV
jgi:hypothetical protein